MKALTANRLIDGEVVFWSEGDWKARFGEAEIFVDDASAEVAAADAQQPTVVVDPYLIDVEEAEGGRDIEVIQHAHGIARSAGRIKLISKK